MQAFLYDRRHWNLLREMVIAQFKMRDQGSLLGVLWSALNPLLMLMILYVVFHFHMGKEIENYAVYLLIGLVTYTHFSNSTVAAMHVFHNLRSLTANAIFPKEILVIATVISRSIEFAVSFLVCIGIAGFAGVQLTGSVFLIVAVILVQTAFALAVSLILSFLYLYLRDIEHIYQLLLRVLFFLTPIFYNMEYLGDGIIRTVVMMNPLTHLTMFARSAIFSGESILMGLAVFGLLTLVLLVMSFLAFKRFEPNLAERV